MATGPPDPAEPAQACRGGKYLLLLQAMHFFRIKVPTSTAKDAGRDRQFVRFQDGVGVVVQAEATGWVEVAHQRSEGDNQFLERGVLPLPESASASAASRLRPKVARPSGNA
jgi:hypothetical protein